MWYHPLPYQCLVVHLSIFFKSDFSKVRIDGLTSMFYRSDANTRFLIGIVVPWGSFTPYGSVNRNFCLINVLFVFKHPWGSITSKEARSFVCDVIFHKLLQTINIIRLSLSLVKHFQTAIFPTECVVCFDFIIRKLLFIMFKSTLTFTQDWFFITKYVFSNLNLHYQTIISSTSYLKFFCPFQLTFSSRISFPLFLC